MPRLNAKAVVDAESGTDDGLLLPRPPGVLSRFWARHPRLGDVLVAVSAFLLSVPGAAIRSSFPTPPTVAQTWLAVALVAVASAALLFRRTRPLAVFAVTLIPALVLPPSLAAATHLVPAVALYAVAVHRSMRACWTAFAAACAVLAVPAAIAIVVTPPQLGYVGSSLVSAIASMLIGGLIGTNVGNRRRYLEALVARSRQLLVERDQQARLGAAAERTRIAREMHDIVSHNLTVVVALADGATATTDPARARAATAQIAETARGALAEMRSMLGVLRDPGAAPGTPLAPVDAATATDAVAAAQRAGVPVVLHTDGDVDDLAADARLAVTRIVQESLTNAMRHAPLASRIEVGITAHTGSIEIVVANDGVGADDAAPTTSPRGGYGLTGLGERAAHVGGTLTAGKTADGRWLVRATLPRRPGDDRSSTSDDRSSTSAPTGDRVHPSVREEKTP